MKTSLINPDEVGSDKDVDKLAIDVNEKIVEPLFKDIWDSILYKEYSEFEEKRILIKIKKARKKMAELSKKYEIKTSYMDKY